MAILQAILPCTPLSKTPILCFSQNPSNFHIKLHNFIKNLNQNPKLSFNKLHAIASDVAVGSSASGEEEDEVFVGPSSQAEVRGEREVADYDWTEEWYPLYLTKNIPEGAPLGLPVFHKQLVLFCDASGQLRCYEDLCPQGIGWRMDKVGHGMPYHFWAQFYFTPEAPTVVEYTPVDLVAGLSAQSPAKGGLGTMSAPNWTNRYICIVVGLTGLLQISELYVVQKAHTREMIGSEIFCFQFFCLLETEKHILWPI